MHTIYAHFHGTIMFVGLSCWVIQPIFMHDPISLDSLGGPALIKNKSFLDTKIFRPTIYCLISPRGLPISRYSCPVRPRPIGILPVSWAEKVPFLLSEFSFLYIFIYNLQTQSLLTNCLNKAVLVHNKSYNHLVKEKLRAYKQKTNQEVARDQTCKYPLPGLLTRGRVSTWLGYEGNEQLVLRQLGGI